ncbi:stalk domain-containing protein [Paenibacillus sp. L3-i20]|uniref:stalk domain-containing protein n=1 Tax=Paenibacillus sp. L3-i20 TaxID=2905833 RepID=UPI001EE101E9|nr:stalk domain-containing protein [Paenibacillus sp. L3-i20]GKU78136.1 hypothetical protein L3i20_v225330 [Paenibacillus sp. L3-i20]
MVLLRNKLLLALASLLIVMVFSGVHASAAIPIGVVVNGLKVTFPDTQPYLDANKRTMVPIRFVTEQLGATLDWQGGGKMKITYGKTSISLKQKATEAVVNGKALKLETPAIQLKGRTMVGLRFVSEALGTKVTWDSEAQTVHIMDAVFEKSKPLLDAWGRLIRTDKQPGNAGDWAYTLQDIPNIAYTMDYRKLLDEGSLRTTASELFKDANLNRENLDKWANRIKRYYDLVFSVDYQLIDSSTWWQSFQPYMNNSSIDNTTRIQYAEWVKKNNIRLEGWAEPEPSMTYKQDGKYMMRTKVRFRVLESDALYGTLLDSFQASYEMKLKTGVWYSGYADIVLSTNTSGDSWPYYGVDYHDHLFFTPVGNIQEEVGGSIETN